MTAFRSLVKRSPALRSLARPFLKSPFGRLAVRSLRSVGLLQSGADSPNRRFPNFSTAGPIPPTISGILQVSLTARVDSDSPPASAEKRSLSHRHVWVNGATYDGMEDNDLRGFLDGRFVAAWNQPKQVHVRLGRKIWSWAKDGDCELFRVLHRWSDIWLPSGAEVSNARLEIDIEKGVDRELEILLYEVHKEWEPGEGGRLRNNNSAPSPGEVWWNEVCHGKQRWGLPGAGLASDTHPDADTPQAPLALGRYHPHDSTVVFESPELSTYVERQASQAKPLLFLLKLSDYLEDIPGTCIDVYSGNHGDDRSTARRPRLMVDWAAADETVAIERRLLLEHGRTIALPPIECGPAECLAVTFKEDKGSERPAIYFRPLGAEGPVRWRPVDFPLELQESSVEICLDTWSNPVPLGEPFTAAIRDTWVTTAPPEAQKVLWTFRSPSGDEKTVQADYEGDWLWRVRFVPDELGRWQYQWKQNFTKRPYESAVGVFDVTPGDRHNALDALQKLTRQMKGSNLPAGRQRASAFAIVFNRLQRVLMQMETPETFPLSNSGEDGGEVGARMDDAREAFGGTRPERPRLDFDSPDGLTSQ